MKRILTDRLVKSLKAAPVGGRYDLCDTIVPGLAVRVTDKGHKTYVLIARPPGAKNPTRRALGPVGSMTLFTARQTAREWHSMIAVGSDPKVEIERRRREYGQKQSCAFAAVAEQFLARAVSRTRKAHEVARDIRREFVAEWGNRPISEITRQDVVNILDRAVDRGAPYQAHNLLGYARRLFDWAIARGSYDLQTSPCDRLKPRQIIGPKIARKRVLTDDELRKVWEAAGLLGYPHGPLVQLLILSGQRKSEVSEMTWRELDLGNAVWNIPARRMKSDIAHAVPLTPEMLDILRILPRGVGDFLFSTTSGARPVNGFSKLKRRLDVLAGFSDWRFHDLRRTMRTGLSALPIEEHVRELVIAHGRKGMGAVYDQHRYADEKKRALSLWTARVNLIVATSPCQGQKLRLVV